MYHDSGSVPLLEWLRFHDGHLRQRLEGLDEPTGIALIGLVCDCGDVYFVDEALPR